MVRKKTSPHIDPDNPPLTDADLARMRSAAEVVPEIVAAHRRGELQTAKPRRTRGPQKAPTKVQTTVRLDADVVGYFKDGGPGWQTRLNDALREAVFGKR